MNAPMVSVVMPVRSGGELLEQAVDSVTSQTMADLELIVVDDGADALTRSAIDRIAHCDGRIVVIHRPAGGIVSALNCGWRAGRGKYIARMDADDVSKPGRLQRQVDLLESQPEIGLVGGQIRCSDLSGRVTWAVSYPTDDAAIRSMLPVANPFSHPAVTMRRSLLQQAGGYRETFRHAEDYDLWVRLMSRCRGANLAEEVLLYRVHPGQSAFRDWRLQTLSMLAIQTSLRIRLSTGRDPLAEVESITEDAVLDLGVTEAELRAVYVTSLVSQSILAGRIAEADACRRLLGEAVAEAKGCRLPPEVTGRLWTTVAAVALEDRLMLKALAALARSARGNPRAVTARAWNWIASGRWIGVRPWDSRASGHP